MTLKKANRNERTTARSAASNPGIRASIAMRSTPARYIRRNNT